MAEFPDKRAAFVEWYLAVVEAANLSDKRYGVKGMNVWTTYGFRARRNLDRVLVREIEVVVELPESMRASPSTTPQTTKAREPTPFPCPGTRLRRSPDSRPCERSSRFLEPEGH